MATAHPNHRLVSSEDVRGTTVYGAGDANIGEIEHLMIDKNSGRVTYAVMSFGGFLGLGLGHSHYPFPVKASEPCRRTPSLRISPASGEAFAPARSSSRKRAAAIFGPIVCEDEGPIPILKMLKTERNIHAVPS